MAQLLSSILNVNDVRYIRRDGDTSFASDNTYSIGTSAARAANIYSVLFTGTATQAQYADLAEMYSCDEALPVGTVMSIDKIGVFDLSPASQGDDVVGVISDKPGFLMNSKKDGRPIGFIGKLKVRISGPIYKGDRIRPLHNGIATATPKEKNHPYFGWALETNMDSDEKSVECIIKK